MLAKASRETEEKELGNAGIPPSLPPSHGHPSLLVLSHGTGSGGSPPATPSIVP